MSFLRLLLAEINQDKKAVIIELKEKLNKTPSGFRHYDISKKLQSYCLDNPEIVASLIFDTTINKRIREDLLFEHSTDHGGSCAISNNPKWSCMMREFIIPRISELSYSDQALIKWYQDVHGL